MEIFETKPKESYPYEVVSDIKTILFSKDKDYLPIVGSFGYRIQKYPGDIDLLEIYSDKKFNKSMYNTFIESLQNTIKRIESNKDFYFSEFKIGKDERYEIDIGKLLNGFYVPSKNLLKKVKDMHSKKLLNKDEYEEIEYLLENKANGDFLKDKHPQTSDDSIHDIIEKIFHNKKTVRWTLSDIKNGYKMLPLSKKLILEKAAKQKSVIKIDVYTFVDNNIMEMSNFLVLAKKNKDGNLIASNLDISIEGKSLSVEGLKDLTEKMKYDVDKFLYSYQNYNPFKAIKRMFSLCRALKILFDNDSFLYFANKILPILESDLSIIYQINSEISYILDINKKNITKSNEKLKKCVNEFKLRLSTNNFLRMKDLNLINEIIDDSVNFDSPKRMDYLTYLHDFLQKILNVETDKFLKGLIIPNYIFPTIRHYSTFPRFTMN